MKYKITLEIDTECGNPGKWDWIELTGEDKLLIVECERIETETDSSSNN